MPGRLYFKIFISFIGVIVITMFMVAALFRFTEGGKFAGRFKQFARAQVTMVRTMVEDAAAANPGYRDNNSQPMRQLLKRLSEAYVAKVWLTDESNTTLSQSFTGTPPTPQELKPEDDEEDIHNMGTFTYIKYGHNPHRFYVSIPYGGTQSVEPGIIHILCYDPTSDSHEKIFILGLTGICLAVALLIMPVSLLITRRLNKLRTMALRIAEGDLSPRADVCGKDEVAKVGRALNTMADALSRMIRGSKELTANVSHELRTPLTRIRIAEEMLRERCGKGGSAHLDSIREDVDALDKLIGKLLTLSKLDLKEAPFTMEPVDIAELTQGILGRLATIAKHKNLTVTANVPDESTARADGEALVTALGNILENGVNHANENGWLKVNLSHDDSAVTLITENSHTPLPNEDLIAIFEPFHRAKGTTTQGFGLGLAIAKKIIEGHGGTAHAENCGGGVRFVVVIPK